MPNNKNIISKIKDNKNIGLILGIENLSVNTSCFFNIEEIESLSNDIDIYVLLNKTMTNSDLEDITNILLKLNNIAIKGILFYDMAVLNISKKLGIKHDLIIFQDHLNASYKSNLFYKKRNINTTFITSDITYEEIKEIKEKTNMNIMMYVYGYLPIFYSKRYLVTNYLKYINKDNNKNTYYIKERDLSYPIKEEYDGTTIYTSEPINLINRIHEIKDIDYFVINGFNIEDNTLINTIDSFLKANTDNLNHYEGFYNTKTIFKVKNNEK